MAVLMAIIYLPSDIGMAPFHLMDFDAFNSIAHIHLEILSPPPWLLEPCSLMAILLAPGPPYSVAFKAFLPPL